MERETERAKRIQRELDRLKQDWEAREQLPAPTPTHQPVRPTGAPMIRG